MKHIVSCHSFEAMFCCGGREKPTVETGEGQRRQSLVQTEAKLPPHRPKDVSMKSPTTAWDGRSLVVCFCGLSILASQVGSGSWLDMLLILCGGVALKAALGRNSVKQMPAYDTAEEDATDSVDGGQMTIKAGVPADRAAAVSLLSCRIAASGVDELSDPLTLLRFLNSREADVDAAAAMHHETMQWRANFHMDKVMAQFGEGESYSSSGNRCGEASTWNWFRCSGTPEAKFSQEHGFFGRLKAVAPDGSPVAVWRFGSVDWSGLEREGLVELMEQALLSHMEDLLQAGRAASQREGRLVRARLVIDAQGVSLSLRRHLGIVGRLLKKGKLYFPEVTCSTTVVRAPACINWGYKIVKPMLTPLMRKKVCILGADFAEGLHEHSGLNVDDLPIFLGGKVLSDLIGHSKPVPIGLGQTLQSVSP